MPNAKEIIKEITKVAHRYRTKNLMLYMLQAVARTLGAEHIYAVTNEGYYANNHLRRDRKIKTDLINKYKNQANQMIAAYKNQLRNPDPME